MLKLRGLPPDIEVAEIRLYIKQRCPMESVMLGELEAEAGGTRRVTVATTCDADAATLSRALSGSRLGAYTLRVEPHRTQNASGVNFRANSLPSGYNEKDNVDHGEYGRKVTGGSVGLGGNSNVNIGGLGGFGGSSEIGSLGRNRKRRGTYSRSLGGNNGQNSGGLGSLGGNNERDGGGLGGLGANNERDGGGLSGLRGNNVGHGGSLGGLGGNSGRDSGGLGGLGGNNWSDSGGLSGVGGNYGRDSGGLGGNNGRDGGGLSGFGGNNVRDSSGLGGLGGNNGRDSSGLGGLGGNNWRDGVGLSGLGGNYGRDSGGLGGLGGNNGRDGSGLSSFGGNNRKNCGDLGGLRRNNGRDSSGLGGLGGDNMRNTGGFGGLVGNYGSDGGGLGGLRGTTGISEGEIGGHAGRSGRNDGDLGGVGGHSSQLYGRGSGGMGKRPRGDDNPVGISSKRMKDSSETGGVFGSDSSQGQGGYSGPDGSYGSGLVGYKNANNSAQGGYSGPDSSHGSGFVGNNNANNSRHGGALGGHNELNSFSGGSGLGGLNAMGEHSPHSYGDRRESEIVPPWVRAKQEVMVQQSPMVSYAAPGGQNSQVFSNTQSHGPAVQMNRAPDSGQRQFGMAPALSSGNVPPWHGGSQARGRGGTRLARRPADRALPNRQNTAQWDSPRPVSPLMASGASQIPFPNNPHRFGPGPDRMQPQYRPPVQPLGKKPQYSPYRIDRRMNKGQPAKNNALLANPMTAGVQTFSPSPFHFRAPGMQNPVTLNILGKPAYDNRFDVENFIKKKCSRIYESMVNRNKIDPKYKSVAAKFEKKMRFLIKRRLRELTNEPFCKNLISLYREAYPTSTDEETMKSVSKQLSLPEIPIPPREEIKANKMAIWRDMVALQIANTALFGKNLNNKRRNALPHNMQKKLMLARQIVRRQLEDILAGKHEEVSSRSDLERLYRTVHRKEEDAALKERVMGGGSKEEPQYSPYRIDRGMNKGQPEGTKRDSYAVKPDEVSVSKLEEWREACACQVADEVLYKRAMSRREREAFSVDAKEKLKAARAMVRDQLDEIIAGYKGTLTTSEELHRLYRERHPPEEDPALEARVMGVAATAMSERISGVKKPEDITANKMAIWRDMVVCQIANTALFGKNLNKARRNALPRNVQKKIMLARQIVRKQLEDILAGEHDEVTSQSDLERLYRAVHRTEEDAALKERVMRGGREEEPNAAAELTEDPTAEDETPDKVVDTPADADITLNNLDQVAATKLKGWCGNTMAQVAYEAMLGVASLSGRQRKRLSDEAKEKIRLAQEIVRKQLEIILAKEHEELYSYTDFYKLYRKFHPPAEDAALSARVMFQPEEPREADTGANKLAGWIGNTVARVAYEALFGLTLNLRERKRLPSDAKEKIMLAQEIVRKQLEIILAKEHEKLRSCKDLYKLYRKFHPPAEDAALSARATRQLEEPSEAAKSNETPAVKDQTTTLVDLPLDKNISDGIILDNLSQGENETVCQRNGDDIKPGDGKSGDTSKKSDSTTDGIKNTDTDDIEDKVDFSTLDIEINADDLEDY